MDHVFTTTREAEQELQRTYDVDAHCLGNLFSADAYWSHFVPRQSDTGGHATTRVAFLGRLGKDKVEPLYDLIHLATIDSALTVTIVGAGPAESSLRKQVASAGVGEKVTFKGSLPDPRTVIAESDVVVTAGRGVLEAATCPRPVIVANSAGIFGALRIDNLERAAAYNYTGRAPESARSSTGALAEQLAAAKAVTRSELACIQAELSEVGDITPLLACLGHSPSG